MGSSFIILAVWKKVKWISRKIYSPFNIYIAKMSARLFAKKNL